MSLAATRQENVSQNISFCDIMGAGRTVAAGTLVLRREKDNEKAHRDKVLDMVLQGIQVGADLNVIAGHGVPDPLTPRVRERTPG